MLSEILTFIFFVLIGLEIREGLSKPKDAALPAIAALGGMALPALIFIALIPGSTAWAVAMPTDVALAIGALSLLGKRVNPAVRLFLLTLAVADDFFSLVVIGIFFREDLHLASAIYTLGAAAIGFIAPMRHRLISVLSPIATFVIIPIYIFINLLTKLDFSMSTEKISIAVVIARVVGKVVGITLFTYLCTRFTVLRLWDLPSRWLLQKLLCKPRANYPKYEWGSSLQPSPLGYVEFSGLSVFLSLYSNSRDTVVTNKSNHQGKENSEICICPGSFFSSDYPKKITLP